MKRIAVVGAGIIGMSSAVAIKERIPDVEVTIIADKWSPNTTGDGSAGFWNPYLLGDVDPSVLRFWCQETFNFLQDLSTSPDASDYGVGLLSCYRLYTSSELPDKESVPHNNIFIELRPMNRKELALFPSQYKSGYFLTTLFAECKKLLPMLLSRFKERGGKVIVNKLENLHELIDDYDAVVNCSGLGAANLVQDPNVRPIRGQTIRVKAPWIKYAVVDEEYHILPNSEETICGGTHQEGDWSTQADAVDKQRIWNGCLNLVPSLKKSKIVNDWVGLRPGRSSPRLEKETIRVGNKTLEVVHNYGHGGSGVTLFWGCAKHAANILSGILTGEKFQISHL